MSNEQYKDFLSLKLSEPMPIEFEAMVLHHLQAENVPEWLRFGLRRFLEASQRMR